MDNLSKFHEITFLTVSDALTIPFDILQQIARQLTNRENLVDDLLREIDKVQFNLNGGNGRISVKDMNILMGKMKKYEWLVTIVRDTDLYDELFPPKQKYMTKEQKKALKAAEKEAKKLEAAN